MSSSLGPAPAPPQSLLPHLDQLLRLLAAAPSAADASAPTPAESNAHQAEIAAAAAAMRSHLAESTRWAGTLKGGDVAEAEVDEVIDVLAHRVREQRRILESLQPSAQQFSLQSQSGQAPSAAPPARQDELQDQEMQPVDP